MYKAIKAIDPRARYNDLVMTIVIENKKKTLSSGRILIVTRAQQTYLLQRRQRDAELLGSSTDVLYDVGVAGIHRLLDKREMLP